MVVLVYTPFYNNHQNALHIENKTRTDAILQKLSNDGILDHLNIIEPTPTSIKDLKRAHNLLHINSTREFCEKGGGYIDYDTYATPLSYEVAVMAAGGAIKASELVADGEKWAYSLGRPPGHHATHEQAMGFCLFNNMAVAIEKLKSTHNLDKFLILDFDVHYGNGTADIFYNDPSVLYISIHQDPGTIFPGKGFVHEQGEGDGKGYNINIPMASGSNNTDYIWILKELIPSLIHEFRPQMVFADAGFDAHQKDPLSRIMVNEDFYEWIAEYLMELAGSLVILLEGGYNLDALALSNERFITALEPSLISQKSYKGGKNKGIDKIEQEYLKNNTVSDKTRSILSEIKDSFSPFFKL